MFVGTEMHVDEFERVASDVQWRNPMFPAAIQLEVPLVVIVPDCGCYVVPPQLPGRAPCDDVLVMGTPPPNLKMTGFLAPWAASSVGEALSCNTGCSFIQRRNRCVSCLYLLWRRIIKQSDVKTGHSHFYSLLT